MAATKDLRRGNQKVAEMAEQLEHKVVVELDLRMVEWTDVILAGKKASKLVDPKAAELVESKVVIVAAKKGLMTAAWRALLKAHETVERMAVLKAVMMVELQVVKLADEMDMTRDY